MRLAVSSDGRSQKSIALTSGLTTIGSASDNTVVLTDRTVSRHHATLKITTTDNVLTDLDSTNGTFLNGVRLRGGSQIGPGDEVRFGAVKFLLLNVDADVDEASTPVRWSIRRWFLLILGTAASGAILLVALKFLAWNGAGLARPVESTRAVSSEPAGEPTLTPEPEDVGPTPWLGALNHYRAMVAVAPVRSNARLSSGDVLHSRYLVTNYADDIRNGVSLGRVMHEEDPGKPGYSSAGAAAGLTSDVDEMWDPSGHSDPGWAIDNWIVAPFHRLSLLDPRLRSVGYGDDCKGSVCIAALNAQTDLAPIAAGATGPVKYPPDNSSVKGAEFTSEWPDPLASCSGYSAPAGLPITLQTGPRFTPILSSYAVTLAGAPPKPIAACGIDSNDYTNPDAATQQTARDILRTYGALIIVPRHPLVPGQYTVDLTASGQSFRWSFRVIQ
jgi:pSer/pThr/pTyr-binding forkhead associated (FHA) protein